MRARALLAPIFFGSSTHLTGRCAPPPAYRSFAALLLTKKTDEEKNPQKFQFGKKNPPKDTNADIVQ